jgi:hypothetical protein
MNLTSINHFASQKERRMYLIFCLTEGRPNFRVITLFGYVVHFKRAIQKVNYILVYSHKWRRQRLLKKQVAEFYKEGIFKLI